MLQRTYIPPRQSYLNHKWLLVNAEGKTLGRLASFAASRLMGKHRVDYTAHMDLGDHVIIINTDKIVVTGNKARDKTYYRHSGYPGGLRVTHFSELQVKHPGRAVEIAIKGMLPKGPLGRQMFRKLKVYSGPDLPHQAQNPKNEIESS